MQAATDVDLHVGCRTAKFPSRHFLAVLACRTAVLDNWRGPDGMRDRSLPACLIHL